MSNHRPRKRFGQHFLINQHVIENIIQLLQAKPGQCLLEIGPGDGALTKSILRHCGQLHVIEIDRDLCTLLESECADLGNLHIYQADALDFNVTDLDCDEKQKVRVFGNLPYNISTPLLFHLLEQVSLLEDMHFMLQQEVAQRLVAAPGCKQYGRLSVMIQYHCQIEELLTVPAQDFAPPPRVQSSFVCLKPYPTLPFIAQDYTVLQSIVRIAFNQRRKTIKNSLRHAIDFTKLETLGIDANARAEMLSVQDYVNISNACV